uniref:CHCH domain-containing protein n=1 Tax=Rhabditophanes sp. KR3021 TaxID=114890 RepID=A0AC35TPA1_9BILA
MGSSQSTGNTQAKRVGETIVITRSDVPEAYKSVEVSDKVVERVNEGKKVKTEAGSQSKEKVESEVPQKTISTPSSEVIVGNTKPTITENEIDAKKAVFKNAAKRVDDRFFRHQRENKCGENEAVITSCLSQNKSTPWTCSKLAVEYDNCIQNFLKEVSKAA